MVLGCFASIEGSQNIILATLRIVLGNLVRQSPLAFEALQSLKRQKLIDNGRNQIVVLNRKGIERAAGKSYGTPEKEYRRLIG